MSKIPIFNAVRIIPRDQDFLDRTFGARGEIYFDQADNTLRLYDGRVRSGISLSRADLDNVGTTAFRAKSVESRLATVIYSVTIAGPQAPDVGNKYVLNGVYRPIPNFVVGYTYVFNQNDATNVYFPNAAGTTVNPHPLNFSADNVSGERGGGTSYLTEVEYRLDGAVVTQAVYNSTAFNTATARQVQITITNATPATLYYWCWNHVLMGNEITVAEPGSGGGVSVSVADTVPSSPNQGSLWFDTISGILHVYYEDIDSAQWVQPSGISIGSSSGVNLTALDATNLTSGTVPDARFPATLPAASGVNLTALNATNLGSGTVPVARLGTAGTRDATTFLRGDNTWAVVAGGGGGGESSASFSTISVAGQSNVVADSATDILTLVAGTGMTITTNAGTDTITIASTVTAGATAFTGLSDAAGLTVDRIYLPAITMLNTTNNGASSYRFDQYGTTDNPTIFAINGTTIAFNLNVSGHPFLIQNPAGNNYNTGLIHVTTGGTVTTGASAQGKTSGTLYWKIPDSISGNYRYQCSLHGVMIGTITIKNFGSI